MFLITGVSTKNGEKEYVGIDHFSGGYPYWSGNMFSAKGFKSKEDAIEFLDSSDSDFKSILKMSDGSVCPPMMLHNIHWDSIKIEEVILNPVQGIDFSNVKNEYLKKREKYDSLKRELQSL